MEFGGVVPVSSFHGSQPILNLCCTRMVVRIMLMVPIYAISSLISLFSLEAAFVIDAIRDIYEVRVLDSTHSLNYNGFRRHS